MGSIGLAVVAGLIGLPSAYAVTPAPLPKVTPHRRAPVYKRRSGWLYAPNGKHECERRLRQIERASNQGIRNGAGAALRVENGLVAS